MNSNSSRLGVLLLKCSLELKKIFYSKSVTETVQRLFGTRPLCLKRFTNSIQQLKIKNINSFPLLLPRRE